MSADDNAPEQAREVEVVARAMHAHELAAGLCAHDWGDYPQTDRWYMRNAETALAALEPIRAAERQEAAREALLAAADEIVAGLPEQRTDAAHGKAEAAQWLRDRADGMTGRSET